MDGLAGSAYSYIQNDAGLYVPDFGIASAYTPLPYQKMIHNDFHRFKVVVAARRVGKSVMAVNELLRLAMTRNLPVPYWYVAPYYHQAKTIAWHLLLKYVPKHLWARKPNESSLTLYLTNGAEITLKSAENPLSLEGTGLGGLVVDEVSAIAHWKFLWDNTLRAMLSDYMSPAIFISKPRGFNHFHDMAKMGDILNMIEGEPSQGVERDSSYRTFRFETEENCVEHNGGYIHHNEILLAQRQLPPEAFQQEYLGRFTKYTGLVHKEFDRAIHIIPDMQLPMEWSRYRGLDFGSNDPSASVRIAIDTDNNWFIERVYKQKDKSISMFVADVKVQDEDLGKTPSAFADPSGKQIISEFNHQGISTRKAYRKTGTDEESWIQLQINMINEHMHPRQNHTVLLPNDQKIENAPSFFILDRPENYALVSELETLAYAISNTGVTSANIDDKRDSNGHYDAWSALRYVTISVGRSFSFGFASANEPDLKDRVQELLNQSKGQAVQGQVPPEQQTQATDSPTTPQVPSVTEKPLFQPPAEEINWNDPKQMAELNKQADLAIVNRGKPGANGWKPWW